MSCCARRSLHGDRNHPNNGRCMARTAKQYTSQRAFSSWCWPISPSACRRHFTCRKPQRSCPGCVIAGANGWSDQPAVAAMGCVQALLDPVCVLMMPWLLLVCGESGWASVSLSWRGVLARDHCGVAMAHCQSRRSGVVLLFLFSFCDPQACGVPGLRLEI